MTSAGRRAQVGRHDGRAGERRRRRCTIARGRRRRSVAPRRSSSGTCMKRFSKIVSVIVAGAVGDASSAMNCACMSVGKPGTRWCGSSPRAAARSARHADPAVAAPRSSAPASRSLSITASRWSRARRCAARTSPPAAATAHRKVPASMRSGDDAVRATPCSRSHALDADPARAVALDPRAHRDQHLGEVGDLRLLGRVLEDGLALGERRGHQQVLGAGDGDHVGRDARALAAASAVATM